jgi:hypothetical protein
MPVVPALRKLRQEDPEVKSSLGYIERPQLKDKPKELLFSLIFLGQEFIQQLNKMQCEQALGRHSTI